MKVENMRSSNGNRIANQFIITDANGDIWFQSYQSMIAVKRADGITLDSEAWDYSTTTGKYRNLFLRETKPETVRKIKTGIYTLADLN